MNRLNHIWQEVYEEAVRREKEEMKMRRCPCCGMRVQEDPFPRDGETWSSFEKDTLSERVNFLVNDLSKKFGRSPNALWWAISKYTRGKRK